MKPGQLVITVPAISDEIKASMNLIREKIGLTWEEGPDNILNKCVQKNKLAEYIKFAKTLIEVIFSVQSLYRTKMHINVSVIKIDSVN